MSSAKADYGFWAFMKLCDIRDTLSPEDYEKIQAFIHEWERKEFEISSGLNDAFYHLYDMEEWWTHQPITPSALFGLVGVHTSMFDQLKQLTKIEDVP